MFTPDAQQIIDRAKDIAATRGEPRLGLFAIAIAIGLDRRGLRLLAQCLGTDDVTLQQHFPPPDTIDRCPGTLPLDPAVREMLAVAKTLVGKAPLAAHPSLVGLPHLVGAVATVLPGLARLPQRPDDAQILSLVTGWIERDARPPSLGELTRRLRVLREELLRRVVGQEEAVHQFIDGLFNAEVVAAADTERRRPSAVFLFAGPPGVGKTFLAETAAGRLDRPFRRFDMSAYAHSHEAAGLVGTPRLYQGAQPGTLTDFVRRNPSAVLLFDEIERAHSTASTCSFRSSMPGDSRTSSRRKRRTSVTPS